MYNSTRNPWCVKLASAIVLKLILKGYVSTSQSKTGQILNLIANI